MIRECAAQGIRLDRDYLVRSGEAIELFPGVREWFARITAYGADLGVDVEHYVISSGLREIIEGSGIAHEFKQIYACEFYYDESGLAAWPKLDVNFTNKTQFVYRINKGILDIARDKELNDSMPDDSKRVPFTNMVYVGDGLSDVPCMKMMRAYGGQAVAVYQKSNRAGVEKLLQDGRRLHFPRRLPRGNGVRQNGAQHSAQNGSLRRAEREERRAAARHRAGRRPPTRSCYSKRENAMDEMNTVGTLYIVATPIGNARDMTERGRQILETADIIAAEDTRRSVVLLNKLGIRGNQLSANHKFNEYGKAKWFIEQLQQGTTSPSSPTRARPCISDPGNELIRAAIDAGIRVVGVPGCCAAVTALSISGFDLSTFFFFGFFPREAADRRRALAMMRRGDTRTYCFYESPKRIMDAVEFFISEHAGVRLCLCNDMTKLHEMTFRGTPAEVRDQLLAKGSYDKGEYVLLCEVEEDYLITEVEHVSSPEALLVDCMVQHDCTAKDAIKLLLKDDNNTYSKNEALRRASCPEKRGSAHERVLDDLTTRLDTLTKAVLSQPLARIGCSRVTIRPLSAARQGVFSA